MRKRQIFLCAVGVALAGWILWGNAALQTSPYDIFSPRLPGGFEGFRIAQISDLHNTEFGEENRKLLNALKQAEPDIIVLTGDLVDSRNTDISVAVALAQRAVKIAPCYYVTGNHESRIGELSQLLDGLVSARVTVLRNETAALERNGDKLTLLGLDDPAFRSDYMVGDSGPVLTAALEKLAAGDMEYTIALSHRPEWFSLYRDFGLDLVFCGHAHGGQFRLPFVGGIVAPNQGFFPRYDAGVFTEKDCFMVVSRGLGPSIIPLRIGNRPELVVVTLHRKET